jgi:hypothetical protein
MRQQFHLQSVGLFGYFFAIQKEEAGFNEGGVSRCEFRGRCDSWHIRSIGVVVKWQPG